MSEKLNPDSEQTGTGAEETKSPESATDKIDKPDFIRFPTEEDVFNFISDRFPDTQVGEARQINIAGELFSVKKMSEEPGGMQIKRLSDKPPQWYPYSAYYQGVWEAWKEKEKNQGQSGGQTGAAESSSQANAEASPADAAPSEEAPPPLPHSAKEQKDVSDREWENYLAEYKNEDLSGLEAKVLQLHREKEEDKERSSKAGAPPSSLEKELRLALGLLVRRKIEEEIPFNEQELQIITEDLVDKGLESAIARAKIVNLTGKETINQLLIDRELMPRDIKSLDVEFTRRFQDLPGWKMFWRTIGKTAISGSVGLGVSVLTGGFALPVYLAGLAGTGLGYGAVEKLRSVSERKLKKQEVQGIVDDIIDAQKIAEKLQNQEKGSSTYQAGLKQLVDKLQQNSESIFEARKELSGWKHQIKWIGASILGGGIGGGIGVGIQQLISGGIGKTAESTLEKAFTEQVKGKGIRLHEGSAGGGHLVKKIGDVYRYIIKGSDVAQIGPGAHLTGVSESGQKFTYYTAESGKRLIGMAHWGEGPGNIFYRPEVYGEFMRQFGNRISANIYHNFHKAIGSLVGGLVLGEGLDAWRGVKEGAKQGALVEGKDKWEKRFGRASSRLSASLPETETAPAAEETKTEASSEAESLDGGATAQEQPETASADVESEENLQEAEGVALKEGIKEEDFASNAKWRKRLGITQVNEEFREFGDSPIIQSAEFNKSGDRVTKIIIAISGKTKPTILEKNALIEKFMKYFEPLSKDEGASTAEETKTEASSEAESVDGGATAQEQPETASAESEGATETGESGSLK